MGCKCGCGLSVGGWMRACMCECVMEKMCVNVTTCPCDHMDMSRQDLMEVHHASLEMKFHQTHR